MEKIDLKKKYRQLYAPSRQHVSLVEVPRLNFAMVDGLVPAGVPPAEAAAFGQALEALYGISYGLKFISKRREVDPIDYTVMALEARWRTESGRFSFDRQEPWYFTAMILQPDHISEELFVQARDELWEKKPDLEVVELRLERFEEGLSVQILHVGPYAEEQRSLAKMDAFLKENGYRYRGDHHEIYLGDPRRAKPENLRTVLRHPVAPA